MSWITVLGVSVAAACLTLSGVHLTMWLRDRTTYANLAFSVLAIGVAGFAWFSVEMALAPTVERFSAALGHLHWTIFVMVTGIAAFSMSYFRTHRVWLGHLAWMLQLVALAVSVVRTPNFDYDVITHMRPVRFLGEQVYVAEGVTSAWHWFGQVSFGLLLLFVIDAAYTQWRQGNPREKRHALILGVSFAGFVFVAAGYAALLFAEVIVDVPHLEFLAFLGVVGPIGSELSSDVLRAAKLSRELELSEAALRESEGRMTLAAEAGRLGMWIWHLDTGEMWMTRRCRDILGLPASAVATYDGILQHVHPLDRDRLESERQRMLQGNETHRTEFRIAHAEDHVRWISSHQRVDRGPDGRPWRTMGICIDITEQRQAEQDARELSGRLIDSQEEERHRLARDLHDDLNQRLSLVSVELQILARQLQPPVQGHLEQLSAGVQQLSADVHSLAYHLHPAKLDQLGLETTARSWCRDVSRQSGIPVHFEASNMPADLPKPVALCLFRILQEGLRNVVRHSQAQQAWVALAARGGNIHLEVKDSGRGFAPQAANAGSGLGLLSMRERVRLLNGTLTVRSQPGEGTLIAASVPAHHRAVDSEIR